jgi:hypothetical protein
MIQRTSREFLKHVSISNLHHLLKKVSYSLMLCELINWWQLVWRLIRPVLEEKVAHIRDARLKKEQDQRFDDRARILQEWYKTYQKTLNASQWHHLPSFSDLVLHPDFRAVLNLGANVSVTSATFDPFIEHMPVIAEQWAERRKSQHRACATEGHMKPVFEKLHVQAPENAT